MPLWNRGWSKVTPFMQRRRTPPVVTEHFHGAAGVPLTVKGPDSAQVLATLLACANSFAGYAQRTSSGKSSWDMKSTFPHLEP